MIAQNQANFGNNGLCELTFAEIEEIAGGPLAVPVIVGLVALGGVVVTAAVSAYTTLSTDDCTTTTTTTTSGNTTRTVETTTCS